MQHIGIISLGCAKNRVNTEQMMYLLSEAGYFISGDTGNADIVLINTCAFIESAKTEAIEVIAEYLEEKERGNIKALIVAGCLPQRHKNGILEQMPGIDAILGTGSFDEIVSVVDGITGKKKAVKGYFANINAPVSETKRIISTSPVWTYLKIAEGCSNRCAYCCIPDIRGSYRSRPAENIINEAEKLASKGLREINLVAQDLTAYGQDIYGKRGLAKLLRALGSIKEEMWIRLLYLYPDGFDDELIDEIANNDKIVKYLDIPVQHINGKILKKMNRRGSPEEIIALLKKLKDRIPGLVLRTSVITGLPGEGVKEFEQLCGFLREMKIQRSGVFAYSPEEGTPAAAMKRPGRRTAEKRAAAIERIQAEIADEYNKSRTGETLKLLVEGRYKDSLITRSAAEAPEVDGYINIRIKTGAEITDTMITAKLTGVVNGEMTGEV